MSSPLTRNAEEGLGASDGVDGYPVHDAAFGASPASDDLPASENIVPPTDVSTSRRDGDLNINERSAREVPPLPRGNDAEIPRNDHEDKGLLKLAKTFLGLFFQAALALMLYRPQPQQDSADSTSKNPPSILFTLVWAAMLFGFAFTMSGIVLQKHHQNVANFCSYAGVFLGALGFFFMMDIFAEKGLGWMVWTVGGLLLLVFAYTLRKQMGI